MKVTVRDEAELARLRELVRSEADARQRDRYRAVVLAAEGEAVAGAGAGGEGGPVGPVGPVELEGDEIAGRLGRSPRFVDKWLGRYRRGGLEALKPGKARGNAPRLAPERHAAFKARLLGGPTAADGGVCALRGRDARRILEQEFGAEMKLSAVYDLMRRLNLSLLRPRPRHPRNDPKQAEAWLGGAPLLPGN